MHAHAPALAQDATQTPAVDSATAELQVTEEIVANKRSVLEQEKEAFLPMVGNVVGPASPETIALQQRQVEHYDQILLILDRQENAIRQARSLLDSRKQAESELQQIRAQGPQVERPWTITLLDNMRDELISMQERKSNLQSALDSAQNALQQIEETLRQNDVQRQQAQQDLEENPEPIRAPLLTARVQLAELEWRLAREQRVLRQIEMRNQKRALQLHEAQIAVQRERISHIEKGIVFTAGHLDEHLEQLSEREAQLTQNRKAANQQLEEAQRQLRAAEDRLLEARSNPETAVSDLLREEVNLREMQRDAYFAEIESIDERLARLESRRDLWDRRYHVFNNLSGIQQMHQWMEESERAIDDLQSQSELQFSNLSNSGRQLVNLDNKIAAYQDQPEVQETVQQQKQFLQHRIEQYRQNILDIESLVRLHNRLIEEIQAQTQSWSLDDVVSYAWVVVNDYLDRPFITWTEQPAGDVQGIRLTYRQFLMAVVYLVAGILLAKLISRSLLRFIFRRMGIHEGAADALQALSFYILSIIAILYALDTVEINLTAFAFLGGALAIGVGFGSQNLLNNFLSGLILLMERPIRKGDYVVVDGEFGEVLEIGARCTRIATFDNIDLMVPNSKLLENKVVNMTLRDQVVRRKLRVGVAYGSNPRDVSRLIKKAVDEHGLVMRKPEPFVVLSDFGENAIIFDVYYWYLMHPLGNGLILDSDIRNRIVHLFADAGITIALPQRDVHLDAGSPVPVRLVREQGPEEASE